MTPEEFSKFIYEAVGKADPTLATLPRLIVASHAAFESGWGQTKMAREGFNYFSITRTRNSTLPIIEAGDKEYRKDGSVITIQQRFAKYASPEEALEDYFRFIKKIRYQPAYTHLYNGHMVAFLTTLRKGGYFTLPLDRYLNAMSAVLGRVSASVLEAP